MSSLYKRGPVTLVAKLKDVDISRRIVSGYYTAFGNKDADGDIGTKGMTLASIRKWGPNSTQPRTKHFLNHNITIPLGLIKDMGEDDFGAFYASETGTHNAGTDFLKMADSGLITEHSYGLTVDDRDGAYLKQVTVWEVSSLTAWGSNPMTPFISLGKSMSKEEEIQYWTNKNLALEKFVRDSTATDELLSNLLLEIKYLTQHIIDLTSAKTATEVVNAGNTGDDYSELLNNLKSIKF